MERFPNQQVIRKMMNGDGDRPGGEAEKAIYNDSIARYKAKLAKKDQPPTAKPVDADEDDAAVDADTPLPQDVSGAASRSLPDKRFSALCKFTPDQLKALRRSAQPGERLQLIAGFSPSQLEVAGRLCHARWCRRGGRRPNQTSPGHLLRAPA